MLSRTSRPATRLFLQPRRHIIPSSQWQKQPQVLHLNARNPPLRGGRRFQSTQSTFSKQTPPTGGNPALVGGLAGGITAFLLGYVWYSYSGAKTLVRTSKQAGDYIETAKSKAASTVKEIEPNKALEWLRSTMSQYAWFVPGGQKYVDVVFDDVDRVREKHGDEVDEVVEETVGKLKKIVGKKGASFESLSEVATVLRDFLGTIAELAGSAADSVLQNHPQLQKSIGGSVEQLKEMGEKYGPQVQKEVDETWSQLADLVKSGDVGDIAEKAQSLVQDKIKKVKEMSNQAWSKGMEQVKPYLDRNPQLKKMIEENQDALKNGNFTQLWDQVKEGVDSGNTDKVEKFIKENAQKATSNKDGSNGLDQLFKMLPGGDAILEKAEALKKVTENHGKDAEKILRETVDEIQEVLKKRIEQAKDLAEQGEKEAHH